MAKIVRIGTRGSELALWQAHAVADVISRAFDDITCELLIFKTQGDINLSEPLSSIGDKGLFTRELETSLLEGTIDMCVHSMKDVLTELPKGCTIAAMLPREDARDALVCGPRMHAHDLASVPAGARLATGSIRRGAFLKSKRPDIIAKAVRGNVETRLKKAQGADYDGAILAVAGLKRLGLDEYISAYIPLEDMIPSPGQAAVGVEIREDDMCMKNICEHIGCATTQACVEAERIVAAGLDGGCHAPVGVHVCPEDNGWRFDAAVFSEDASTHVRISHHIQDAGIEQLPQVAQDILTELMEKGAYELLHESAGK